MPINESKFPRRSGLTSQQRHEAEIALYGGDMQKNAHDEPTAPPVGTMDLNNPPREPYHYEPFPATLYKGKEHEAEPKPAEKKK